VDTSSRTALWHQFGAAIDMLDNALHACPEELWGDRTRQPQFWYLVYHTLFWLDLYLTGSLEGFSPPAPFTLSELDPAGVMPDRVYTREELAGYLQHGRAKCRSRLASLTPEEAGRRVDLDWLDLSFAELLLYNLRHVQHGAAQLNLILRQCTGSAPPWIAQVTGEA
jgi:hypothetical protein